VAGPLLTKGAIDRYLAPNRSSIHTPVDPLLSSEPLTGITQVSLLYLAACSVSSCSNSPDVHHAVIGQKAMFDLRRELMTHLQKLDIAFYDRNRWATGYRVTTDVDVLTSCSRRAW